MTLELNEVLLEGASRTVSMIAESRQLVCLTGGRAEERTRLLRAVMGFVPLTGGVLSIDGTPLNAKSAPTLRRCMAYAPHRLDDVGHFPTYEAPSVQSVFTLKANQQVSISNGILSEEVKRTGCTGKPAQLLAVAALLQRPILLCDEPPVESAPYLQNLARQGLLVLTASASQTLRAAADVVVEL